MMKTSIKQVPIIKLLTKPTKWWNSIKRIVVPPPVHDLKQ